MRFLKRISLWLLLASLSLSTPVFSQEVFHSLISQASTVVYDTDYQAVLTQATALGYTLPDASNRALQNQMVLDLKAAGIWTELDIFYPMLTNINFATLNWIAPTLFQLTLVNSPTYNSATGFEGNGTTSYLSTNWDPATNGVNFTINDCGMGGMNTNELDNTGALYGSANATNVSSTYLQPMTSGNLNSRVNQSATNVITNAASIGRYHQKRTGANAIAVFKNGSSIGTGTTAAVSRTSSDTAILAINVAGTISGLSTRQIRYFWAGASLDTLEATFDGILDTYY